MAAALALLGPAQVWAGHDTAAGRGASRCPSEHGGPLVTPLSRGGLTALLTYKEAGAPAGQKSLPAAVCTQLQARLATASGLASYGAIQQWLREACALEVPYQTLYGIVHYQLKAKLKRPRPSHAKKTPLRPRTVSSSVRAGWVPSPP